MPFFIIIYLFVSKRNDYFMLKCFYYYILDNYTTIVYVLFLVLLGNNDRSE